MHLFDGTFELFRYFLSPAAAFDRTTPDTKYANVVLRSGGKTVDVFGEAP